MAARATVNTPAPQEPPAPAAGGAAPARSIRAVLSRALSPKRVIVIVLIVVLAYLVLPPVVLMIWKSFVGGSGLSGSTSISAYKSISSGLGQTAAQTAIFVAGTTAVSMIMGTLLAWTVARTDAAAKWLAYVAAFVGLAIPGISNIIGWLLLFGNGSGQADQTLASLLGHPVHLSVESMPGMIAVESLMAVPIVFFLLIGPMQSFNASLEEAGSMHGAGNWMIMRRITAPLMLPAIGAAALLILIRSVQAFEVPLLIGVPAQAHIFTAQIYQALKSSLIPDYSSAAAYGTVLVVALLLLVTLEQRMTREARRFAVVTGKGDVRRAQKLGRARWLPTVLYVVLLIGYLLPALYLVFASFEERLGAPLTAASFGLGNYRALFSSSGFSSSVVDTVAVAIATAAFTVILSLVAAWVSVRSARSRAAQLINVAANVPLVIPGVVLGFGVLLFYLYSPVPLFGTIWVIVVAFTALYLPYGMRYLRPAILSISADLEESARVSGASEMKVIRRVVLPLVSPSVAGTALYAFFNSFRELAVAALLVTAATPLLSTQLLDQLVNGNLSVVSALGTVILAICLGAGFAAFRLAGLSSGTGNIFGHTEAR